MLSVELVSDSWLILLIISKQQGLSISYFEVLVSLTSISWLLRENEYLQFTITY